MHSITNAGRSIRTIASQVERERKRARDCKKEVFDGAEKMRP